MDKATMRYNLNDLGLSVPSIAAAIGYGVSDIPEMVSQNINECLDLLERVCDIRAEYRVSGAYSATLSSGSFSLDGVDFRAGKIIVSQLAGSEKIALFLATAGSGPGEESRRYMAEGDSLKAYILDIIGSEIVEAAVGLMHRELGENQKEKNYNITNRFSPGYCGWDVKEQHKLFSFMQDNYCAITLSESALMNPVKSVSGIIGIGREVSLHPYMCGRCDVKECIHRDRK